MTQLIAGIWMPDGATLWPFAAELGLIGAIVAVLIVAMIGGRSPRLAAGTALVGTLATLLLTMGVARDVSLPHAGLMPPDASPMLLVDNFSIFFKFFLMLFLATVIWLWIMGESMKSDANQSGRELPGSIRTAPAGPEFFVLLLTSALGMALMVGTLNLLVIVIAIEMASLPSYAIVGSDKRSRISAEASLKYVLFGAASAAIMVYGVSLLYGRFGTLDLSDMAAIIAVDKPDLITWIGLFGLCGGIAFKISAVPFHFWCPDVFQGAPTEITTWLSVASKAAGLGLLCRVVYVFAGSLESVAAAAPLAWGIGIAAAVTCTLGNLAALRQVNVKRILAYSSIAHAGYMMMGAAILVPTSEATAVNIGLAAVIAYLFVYLIMNLGAFGVTAMVAWRSGTDHLDAFTGLGRRAPWLALPMAVCLFSLVGLPPLGGFAAKWWLLLALGEATQYQTWLWGLIIVAVVNTAISLYYYVRIIKQMYLGDDANQPEISVPTGGLILANVCAVLLVLLGTVFFNPLGDRAYRYASNLFVADDFRIAREPASPGERTSGSSTDPEWFLSQAIADSALDDAEHDLSESVESAP